MQTFPIAPAGARPMWALAIVLAAVIVSVGLVLFFLLRGGSASRFEVSPAGIRLGGGLYGRFIPAAQIRGDSARRVDLREEAGLRPRWRTFGIGLPGYQAGWFRLRDGEKALLYLTDRTRAVYVPTTAGYALLVSPQDPD